MREKAARKGVRARARARARASRLVMRGGGFHEHHFATDGQAALATKLLLTARLLRHHLLRCM